MPYPKPTNPDYCPGSGRLAEPRSAYPCPVCGRRIASLGWRIGGRRAPHLRTTPRASASSEYVRSVGLG